MKLMSSSILLLLMFLSLIVYFAVEERERRATNPHGPGWLARVKKSAWRYIWFLGATVIAYGVNLIRGKDSADNLLSFAVGLSLYVLLTLQAATLSLPRNDKGV